MGVELDKKDIETAKIIATENGVDPSLFLDAIGDQERVGRMLISKWSHFPTRDGDGQVRYHDWLGAESVDHGFPDLKTPENKLKMAILLADQSTGVGDLALPTKFALPIVRRVYALVVDRDFGVVQPLPGPTGFVFWLDFLRMSDTTNLLSIEYNWAATGELAPPAKGKLVLSRTTIQVVKLLMGVTWSLESQEDARAQLGLDLESELLREFSNEFVRDLFGRHLLEIWNKSVSGTSTGSTLPGLWLGPNSSHVLATGGGTDSLAKKANVYAGLIDADTDFVRVNRFPSDGIIAGYGLAGWLQKIETATQATSPANQNANVLGITDYGTFAGRWRVWGTDFIPDNQGFMYKRNPTQLQAGHVYAPYIPLQVMPAIYADFAASDGTYKNVDAFSRNLRERSAHIVTKPYAFQPVSTAFPYVF